MDFPIQDMDELVAFAQAQSVSSTDFGISHDWAVVAEKLGDIVIRTGGEFRPSGATSIFDRLARLESDMEMHNSRRYFDELLPVNGKEEERVGFWAKVLQKLGGGG